MSSATPSPARLLAPALLLVAACITTEQHATPLAPAPAVSASVVQAWQLLSATGEPLGFLVRFEENAPGTDSPRGFYSVRNPYQQELGMVDDLGRSWRFELHRSEPSWLGSGSVSEAASRILGTPVQLVETSLTSLAPASPPEN